MQESRIVHSAPDVVSNQTPTSILLDCATSQLIMILYPWNVCTKSRNTMWTKKKKKKKKNHMFVSETFGKKGKRCAI